MIDILKKYWLRYIVDITVAVIIINISLTAFWIYFFFTVLLKIDSGVDYLRKLIRVFQVGNEDKLMAITKNLNITEKDIVEIQKKAESDMTEAELKDLHNDIDSLLKR